METSFLVCAVIASLGFIISSIHANILIDRMLKKLYNSHRELWESLGKPTGWCWAPPGRVLHPFQPGWLDMSSLRDDPAWLAGASDIIIEFRRWQKIARRASFVFFPLVVLFGSLAAWCGRK